MPDEAFDLRLAAPFVVVAEELHFGRAAERLGIRQPALSQQVARLERQLGVQLLARGGGQVALTAAGARFVAEAREMLARVRRAEEAVRGGSGAVRVHLCAANHPGIRDIVGSFVAAHPQVLLSTTHGAPTAVSQAVRTGAGDVAFGPVQEVPPGLQFASLGVGSLGVVTAADHPIALRGRASWTDLEGEGFLVVPPGVADGLNHLLRTTLGLLGVRVREVVTATVPNAAYLQHQIATGVGVLVTPVWTFDPVPPALAWTLLHPERGLDMGITWDERSAGEPVRRFVAWARSRTAAGAPADACEA